MGGKDVSLCSRRTCHSYFLKLHHKHVLKIVQSKSSQCFFHKMCSTVSDPGEIVSLQWQKTLINACFSRRLIYNMIYVHPWYLLMTEGFRHVGSEINEILTRTETMETFKGIFIHFIEKRDQGTILSYMLLRIKPKTLHLWGLCSVSLPLYSSTPLTISLFPVQLKKKREKKVGDTRLPGVAVDSRHCPWATVGALAAENMNIKWSQ